MGSGNYRGSVVAWVDKVNSVARVLPTNRALARGWPLVALEPRDRPLVVLPAPD